MKFLFFITFIISSSLINAQQNASKIDSISKSILGLAEKNQLRIINEIPDKIFVAELEKSEKIFQKAERLATKLNDSTALANVFFKQGIIQAYKNNRDKSVEFSLKAIKIFEQKKDFANAGKVYGALGYNLRKKDLPKAKAYMQKGIKLLSNANDLVAINPVLDNYGTLLLQEKKVDSAFYYQKKSLIIKKILGDNFGIGFSYANMANTFAAKKNYRLAKVYVDSSTTIRKKINDNYGITVNYVFLAEIYLLENNLNKAIDNFKICARLSNENKYRDLEQYCYENLSGIYLKLNDYKNALFYKDKFQQLKDESESIVTKVKIEELQIQFETEKKEKQLAEAKIDLLAKEAKIKKRTSFLISALGLAFLLGLIGFLVYKQQRLKNQQIIKENELRQALIKIENQNNLQQQRLEISKDLHDNIGSKLTFVISALDNLKYFEFTKDRLYDKFDSIGSFTRSTITDLRDTIWAMNKEEITLEDLKIRTANFIDDAREYIEGIEFEFNFVNENQDFVLDSKTGIEIYRIIQEAVNNGIKHANATKISVDFKKINNKIFIAVSDNGSGFDAKAIEIGNGLKAMQKRANAVQAHFLIEQLQPGTKISLQF